MPQGPNERTHESPTRKRRWLIISVLGALGIAILWVTLAYLVIYQLVGRPAWETQSLETTLKASAEIITVEDDTDTICAVLRCEEGWRTSVGNYLRFESEGKAEYSELVIGGDTVRNGRLILDRNGLDLSETERSISVDLLFPAKDWD